MFWHKYLSVLDNLKFITYVYIVKKRVDCGNIFFVKDLVKFEKIIEDLRYSIHLRQLMAIIRSIVTISLHVSHTSYSGHAGSPVEISTC